MEVLTLHTDKLNIPLLKLLSVKYITVIEKIDDGIIITLYEKST